jgi:flagellar basal body-associated protein FliL
MQKAKLDILENIPEIDTTGVMEGTDEVSEIPPMAGKQWASNKLILLVSTLVLAVLVIAGGVWFYFMKSASLMHKEKIVNADGDNFGKESKVIGDATEIGNTAPPAVPLSDKVTTIYFKDFIIDLRDTGGRSKILVCEVAIEISENQNAAQLVNNKDVRRIIYLSAKGKSAVALRSLEERKRLKNEMTTELEKMLGEGVIKNLYFINYLIM